MPDHHSTLRAQRRVETQRTIQAHAVRLFTERGYDATTMTDVAEAAGVSPMTVYRHFPTKEDLVLLEQHSRLVAERIAASSAAQPLVRRIGRALIESAAVLTDGGHGAGLTANEQFLLARLQLMISTPALRAKHLDSQYALQQAIVDGLGGDATEGDAAFHAQAAASACLGAMHTALVRWAEDGGRAELPDLIAKALAAAFGEDIVGPGPAG
ncbi:TetR/AcrR family transcriptional regulator [Streptomyces durmitorensis]|uniref:TetR/AcrR family transcriptional regulator n=1 Tax=Streptomyces durmitorensis TaxID=319947 RepID=A0ABY4PKR8_9ACTN|nr:TetR/AcrR family transcriptional regulator [Streptomyces durmitorensis]UQT53975.1 TetR/AcrR family transcriptional regulator [Streptomyces durmitorensis]